MNTLLDRWIASSFSATLVIALGACDERAAPTATALSPNTDVVTDVGTASTPYGDIYAWRQGQPATYMGGSKGAFGVPASAVSPSSAEGSAAPPRRCV